MTAYKITPADSEFSTTGTAFDQGSAGADSLTVDESAYLVSTFAGFGSGYGALLNDAGAWSVTVHGTIYSKNNTGLLVQSDGSPTNITVGANGQIGSGSFAAIVVSGGAANIKNAGLISAGPGENAIVISENDDDSSITNTGIIIGDILASVTDFDLAVTNSGSIEGKILYLGGNDKLTNSGQISNLVSFGEGNNSYSATSAASSVLRITAGSGNDTVSIAGFVDETVLLDDGNNKFTLTKTGVVDNFSSALNAFASGSGDDVFSNAGRIDGGVALGDGNNSFTNSGTVNGHVTSINGATAKFTNSGVINGSVGFSTATTTISNSGTINGSVNGSTLADTFTNTKTITGPITLGDGNDKFTNSGQTGAIDLGNGDDIYTGGSNGEGMSDSNHSDNVKLGAGNDTYVATGAAVDGVDVIDGGTGIDTYIAIAAVDNLRINLDTVVHDVAIINLPSSPIAAKTASGTGVGTDTITGFEIVGGGSGNDIIFGNASANELHGNNGDDRLFGFGGNDYLNGGSNDDVLVGGLGADTFSGGTGVDTFLLISTKESGITKATRDVIFDFNDDIDFISLSLIDANTKNGAAINDPFSYINTGSAAEFTKATGQLRSYWTASGHIIEGDVNGDGKADFSIEVLDSDHSIIFTQTDFIL